MEVKTFGVIGAGQMGNANLSKCATYDDVNVAAVCDVSKPHLNKTLQKYDNKPKAFHDYRELLADKGIDAVIIATPPHWHCLMAVEACAAGKDIYLQKPMTLHAGESLAVRNAVRRHKRICQLGTQVTEVLKLRLHLLLQILLGGGKCQSYCQPSP